MVSFRNYTILIVFLMHTLCLLPMQQNVSTQQNVEIELTKFISLSTIHGQRRTIPLTGYTEIMTAALSKPSIQSMFRFFDSEKQDSILHMLSAVDGKKIDKSVTRLSAHFFANIPQDFFKQFDVPQSLKAFDIFCALTQEGCILQLILDRLADLLIKDFTAKDVNFRDVQFSGDVLALVEYRYKHLYSASLPRHQPQGGKLTSINDDDSDSDRPKRGRRKVQQQVGGICCVVQ